MCSSSKKSVFSFEMNSQIRKGTALMSMFNLISILVLSARESAGDMEYTGVYGTLRGFVGQIGNVMKEVSSGMHKLSEGVRNVEEFLDATVDEDCYFVCSSGQAAKPNPVHTPTSNGCGSFGMEDLISANMLPLTEFVNCCDIHDICYGSCGNDKDECDLKFKKCLYGKCSDIKDSVNKLTHKSCQAGAKLLHTATTMLGCKPYIDAQQEACLCSPVRTEF